jgi:hypothetical protein
MIFSLRTSALRETWEESGIVEKDIQNLMLRRVLVANRPGSSLGVLLYFTGELEKCILPTCPEGQLFWLSPDHFDSLDTIETTIQFEPVWLKICKTAHMGATP